MNDALDAALVLATESDKPSKPYRTSAYTVREYVALPYAKRLAVDAECDERLVFSIHPHSFGHTYRLGRLPKAA